MSYYETVAASPPRSAWGHLGPAAPAVSHGNLGACRSFTWSEAEQRYTCSTCEQTFASVTEFEQHEPRPRPRFQ